MVSHDSTADEPPFRGAAAERASRCAGCTCAARRGPLGEARPIAVDVRFVAASQSPLDAAVASGRFRSDLRARLEGMSLRLALYAWPLNVRELVTFVRRSVTAHANADALSLAQALALKPELGAAREAARSGAAEPRRSRAGRGFPAREVEAMQRATERHGDSVGKAAAELGISRYRAYRLLKARSR